MWGSLATQFWRMSGCSDEVGKAEKCAWSVMGVEGRYDTPKVFWIIATIEVSVPFAKTSLGQ